MSSSSILPLIAAVFFLLLGFIVWIKGNKKSQGRGAFFISCLVTFWWQFSWFVLFNTKDYKSALIIAKIGHIGVFFIPSSLYHYYSVIINDNLSKKNSQIALYYAISVVFVCLLGSPWLITSVKYFSFGYYPQAGILHPLFITFLAYLFFLIVFILVSYGNINQWQGQVGQKIKLLLSSLIIYSLAAFDFLVNYGVDVYPLGVISILFSVVLSAYIIIKYQFFDFKFIVSNIVIFTSVYVLAFSIPFMFYKKHEYALSVLSMAFLASIGPFVFLKIQKSVHDRYFKSYRRSQYVLTKLSKWMIQTRSYKKLGAIIAVVIRKVIKPNVFALYFRNEADVFILFEGDSEKVPSHLPSQLPIFSFLEQKHLVGTFSEMSKLIDLSGFHFSTDGLVVPAKIRGVLILVMFIGDSKDKISFSYQDVRSFSVLSGQIELALENVSSILLLEETQKRIFESEKMVTLGHLAGALSHQLGNKLNSIGLYVQHGTGRFLEYRESFLPGEKCDEAIDVLKKAKEGIESTSDFIKNLLNFATNRDSKDAIDIERLVDSVIEFKDLKAYVIQVYFEKQFDMQGRYVFGNFAQLQDALLNIIDNAVYSMNEKSSAGIVKDYKPRIKFIGRVEGDRVVLIIEDNGMGIRLEDQKHIFNPNFSTKKESGAGHGFGVYFVREVVENRNGGRVQYFSEYGHGVRVEIKLPILVK